MKTKPEHKKLFDELEVWGRRKDSFSINDFLKEKKLSFDKFEHLANSSKKFTRIWGKAESQAWENLLDALFTKSLPRSKIAAYIKEAEEFQGQDPEEVMRDIETSQTKLEIHLTAIGDSESLRKYGKLPKMNQFEAMMKCDLERGLITQEEYDNYMREDEEESDEDEEDDGEDDWMSPLLPQGFTF